MHNEEITSQEKEDATVSMLADMEKEGCLHEAVAAQDRFSAQLNEKVELLSKTPNKPFAWLVVSWVSLIGLLAALAYYFGFRQGRAKEQALNKKPARKIGFGSPDDPNR